MFLAKVRHSQAVFSAATGAELFTEAQRAQQWASGQKNTTYTSSVAESLPTVSISVELRLQLSRTHTTQPMEEHEQLDFSLRPEAEADALQQEQSSAMEASPSIALLDLPAPLLVRISAYLGHRALLSFAHTCTHTQHLLQANKPLYAACRALSFKTSRAARLSAGLTQIVYRPPADPAQIDALGVALSVQPGLTPVEVLCRPQLADWVLGCAGLRGDGRVFEWVLGLSDEGQAYCLRHANVAYYDRAWAVAAGAAATGPTPSLFQALCAMPCAPGQPHGLRRAHQTFQTTLMCHAVTGPDPHTALELVTPLSWLPYQDPSKAIMSPYPWSNEGTNAKPPAIQAQESRVHGALREAALHALRYGYVGALVVLAGRGVTMESVFVEFAGECETRAHGAALKAMLEVSFQSTDNQNTGDNQALKDTIDHYTLQRAWRSALRAGRIPCMYALMDACFHRLTTIIQTSLSDLAKSHTGSDLHMLRALLSHMDSEQRQQFTGREDILLSAVEHGAEEVIAMLLQHGWAPTKACVKAAASPAVLRVLLDAVAARGAEGLESELPRTEVIAVMHAWASAHDADATQVLRMRCAHVFLEHVLQRPGVHSSLMRLYAGYRGDSSDMHPIQGSKEGSDASAHGLWGEDDGNQPGLHLMHTLLILNETRVLDAVLRMAHGLAFDQAVLKRYARHCARQPGRGPPFPLLNLHERGLSAATILLALCDQPQPLYTLALCFVRHTSAFREPSVRLCGNPRELHYPHEEPGLRFLSTDYTYQEDPDYVKVISTVYEQYASTGSEAAFALLRLLVTGGMQGRSRPVPVQFAWQQGWRQRQHYRLLTWVLECVGADALGLECGDMEGDKPLSLPHPGEVMGRWAPLPFVTLCVAHGVAAEPLLSGLCQRPDPPMVLITQMLSGQPGSLARSDDNGPRGPGVHGAPRPDVDWAGGRMLRHAAATGSIELVDLLLANNATKTAAAVHSPDTPAHVALRIISATGGKIPRGPFVDTICASVLRDSGDKPIGEVVEQLIGMGAEPADLVLAAASLGSGPAMQYLVEEKGQDPSMLFDQPIILAAQHDHRALVEWLLTRGASAESALYGAVLGAHEGMVRFLLQHGADPRVDEGAALTAALESGNMQLVNLLLPEE